MMTSNHVHTWVYSIENAGVCQRDCVCGAHEQIDLPKLEQQLAQATALLEEIGYGETGVEQVCWCIFCEATTETSPVTQNEQGQYTWTQDVLHQPACPIARIRAFLADENAAG